MKPRIVIICGPTGIGKTSTAINLSQEFSGEIIGADSMQIYREMDIGTAKPTPVEQALVPHHMVNVINPDQPFDAGSFAKMADQIIQSLIKKNRTPFVVGGTGLYIKALACGLSRARPADPKIISRLKKESKEYGSETLHKRLQKCDPKAAQKIHPNDTFRVTRALEIYEATGKSISSYHDQHGFSDEKYQTLKICLHSDREKLYERINRRVDIMIDEGFLDEVENLLEKGYSEDLKSMQSLGYRHMVAYVSNMISWEDAIETMKRDTRRYAKRQLTWFKADPEIKWFAKDQIEQMRKEIQRFLI